MIIETASVSSGILPTIINQTGNNDFRTEQDVVFFFDGIKKAPTIDTPTVKGLISTFSTSTAPICETIICNFDEFGDSLDLEAYITAIQYYMNEGFLGGFTLEAGVITAPFQDTFTSTSGLSISKKTVAVDVTAEYTTMLVGEPLGGKAPVYGLYIKRLPYEAHTFSTYSVSEGITYVKSLDYWDI
jgi:hypothetical protein